MNTVIEIQYKKYSENVIVTIENVDEVLDHLFMDKDIVNYSYVVEGDINLEYELAKSDFACTFYDVAPSKVKTIIKMHNKLFDLQSINWFESEIEAFKHYDKIEALEKRIDLKKEKLSNLENLFI